MTNTIEIKPIKNLDAVVTVPGSKSITNRALILGALAEGKSSIKNGLFSDDTKYMIAALKELGIDVSDNPVDCSISINGSSPIITAPSANLFVGNAGTAMRFLTAFLTLGNGRFEIDGVERMRSRPIQDLIDGLNQLGTDAVSKNGTGCPPVLINANSLKGGICRVKGDLSSQYISALLMVAPCAASDVTIEIIGDLVSKRYVDITLSIMKYFGADVENRSYNEFIIKSGAGYAAKEYYVEADASSASYFLAAAAITGGKVRVNGIGRGSVQGDANFSALLEKMGCKVEKGDDYTEVTGGPLKGIDADMSEMPDLAQTLAVAAIFAKGKTRITNVANLRIKETDRIKAVVTELAKFGVKCVEHEDGFEIEPPLSLNPAVIDTYDDHRMAMSFALAGLNVEGVKINDPECVSKSFPDFFERLKKL